MSKQHNDNHDEDQPEEFPEFPELPEEPTQKQALIHLATILSKACKVLMANSGTAPAAPQPRAASVTTNGDLRRASVAAVSQELPVFNGRNVSDFLLEYTNYCDRLDLCSYTKGKRLRLHFKGVEFPASLKDDSASWQSIEKELKRLYKVSEAPLTVKDLEDLAKRKLSVREYVPAFSRMASRLEEEDSITKKQKKMIFMAGLPNVIYESIQDKIMDAEDPSIWDFEMIKREAIRREHNLFLAGDVRSAAHSRVSAISAAPSYERTPASSPPVAPSQAASQQTAAANARGPMQCYYCGEVGHGTKFCSVLGQDCRRNLVMYDGKVVKLPNGQALTLTAGEPMRKQVITSQVQTKAQMVEEVSHQVTQPAFQTMKFSPSQLGPSPIPSVKTTCLPIKFGESSVYQALMDHGSMVNTMTKATCDELCLKIDSSCAPSMIMANGTRERALGTVRATVSCEAISCDTIFLVTNNQSKEVLLGLPWLHAVSAEVTTRPDLKTRIVLKAPDGRGVSELTVNAHTHEVNTVVQLTDDKGDCLPPGSIACLPKSG